MIIYNSTIRDFFILINVINIKSILITNILYVDFCSKNSIYSFGDTKL